MCLRCALIAHLFSLIGAAASLARQARSAARWVSGWGCNQRVITVYGFKRKQGCVFRPSAVRSGETGARTVPTPLGPRWSVVGLVVLTHLVHGESDEKRAVCLRGPAGRLVGRWRRRGGERNRCVGSSAHTISSDHNHGVSIFCPVIVVVTWEPCFMLRAVHTRTCE